MLRYLLRKRGIAKVLHSSHTSKGFSTKPIVSRSAEQEPPSSTSEFLKAFGVLLEAPKKTGVVGRWDWHLWQMFLMLLPPLGVTGLAYFARYDMRTQEAILSAKKQEKEDEEQMAQQEATNQKLQARHDTHTAANRQQQAEIQARLEELERAVRLMHARQLAQEITGGPACSAADKNLFHPSGHQASSSAAQQDETAANQTATAQHVAHRPASAVAAINKAEQPNSAGTLSNADRQTQPVDNHSTTAGISTASDTPSQVQPKQAGMKSTVAKAVDGRQGSHLSVSMPAATPPHGSPGNVESPLAGRSQPTAVAAIREYAKGQIHTAFTSVKQMFAGKKYHSEQGKQEQQLKSDKI
ncbi:hypothetical protein WJX77_002670 [Trebouxia sp. C0004]